MKQPCWNCMHALISHDDTGCSECGCSKPPIEAASPPTYQVRTYVAQPIEQGIEFNLSQMPPIPRVAVEREVARLQERRER